MLSLRVIAIYAYAVGTQTIFHALRIMPVCVWVSRAGSHPPCCGTLRYYCLAPCISLYIGMSSGGGRCFVELLRKRAFTAARSFAYRCLGLQARWQKQAIKRRPSYGAVCVAASLASRRPVLHLHAPLARLGGMPPRAHAALQRPSFN